MRKKNWVEFNNEPFRTEDNEMKNDINKCSKIYVYKQKKGKKGKTVTIITGFTSDTILEAKSFLKKLKIFCGTGGKFSDKDLQLQGDLVDKVKDFLRKENYNV
tara:strand:+ start:27733 stop:28041 length:309 start_codon:yes stop_codon:yes gene_type:complete